LFPNVEKEGEQVIIELEYFQALEVINTGLLGTELKVERQKDKSDIYTMKVIPKTVILFQNQEKEERQKKLDKFV